MGNNDLYQVVLLVSAVAGWVGAFALAGQLSWLPVWLAGILASFVGYVYGEIQARVFCRLPRIRQWGEVTTSGFWKVGCTYFTFSLLFAILAPVFQAARQRALATGHIYRPPSWPAWAPLAAVALPLALSSIIAVVGWGLHLSERSRGRR